MANVGLWPGYLWLIREPSPVWYQSIITSVIHINIGPRYHSYNPTSHGAVTHKMVNISKQKVLISFFILPCIKLLSLLCEISTFFLCFVFCFGRGHLHNLFKTVLSWIFFRIVGKDSVVTPVLGAGVRGHVRHVSGGCEPLYICPTSPLVVSEQYVPHYQPSSNRESQPTEAQSNLS